DRVDGAHVVTVTPLDRAAGLEIDAERGAEQRLLHVMDRERVAREEHVDEAAADEIAEIPSAARMDDDRAGHDGDALAGRFRVAHHRRDPRDAHLDAPLRRDLVRHEREPESIARLEFGDDLDAAYAADDRVPFPDLAQFPADGRAPL